MKPPFLKPIPAQPGCYLMKDSADEIIYVGKAKNLRSRVASYWNSKDPKTMALVSRIADIEYIIVDNEVEALITEAQLIAKYHPYYNIDLKGGGRYAFIQLTKEKYPKLRIVRKVTPGGRFFGPYPNAGTRNAAVKAANDIFKLCTAKNSHGRPCFRYHLGRCMGSCAELISVEEYSEVMKRVERFLKGEFHPLIEEVERHMNDASGRGNYEAATLYRDQYFALQGLEHQKVSVPKIFDQNVINYIVHEEKMIIQVFSFRKGIISERKEFTLTLSSLGEKEEVLIFQDFLQQYYLGHDIPHEIVVPILPPEVAILEAYLEKLSGRKAVLTVPKQGIKKGLLDMVHKNLLLHLKTGAGQLYELGRVLHLKQVPYIINCVDISHLGGTNTVASMVQFVNGEPRKSGYRKFIVKTVEGINDFASMKEVLERFFQRILDGKEKRPDLLVVDGGRGQLNIALSVLEDMAMEMPVVGLAKRLEEIYVPWAKEPIAIPFKDPSLQMLRALRDEAHRFAITFQRKKRTLSGK